MTNPVRPEIKMYADLGKLNAVRTTALRAPPPTPLIPPKKPDPAPPTPAVNILALSLKSGLKNRYTT